MTATRAFCPCMDDSVEMNAGSIINDSISNPYAIYNGAPLINIMISNCSIADNGKVKGSLLLTHGP